MTREEVDALPTGTVLYQVTRGVPETATKRRDGVYVRRGGAYWSISEDAWVLTEAEAWADYRRDVAEYWEALTIRRDETARGIAYLEKELERISPDGRVLAPARTPFPDDL